MAASKHWSPCEFDTFFTKSVPPILEGIFFSLDYDSFVVCQKVCKAWNELHSSEIYKKKAKILLVEKMNNEKKLWQYSRYGEVEEVGNLLRNGVNPNCATTAKKENRPLVIAASNGHGDVVRLLLNMGADPNMGDRHSGTPLYYAARNGQEDVTKLLIDEGADPDKASCDGGTPLLWAAMNDNFKVVKVLLGP